MLFHQIHAQLMRVRIIHTIIRQFRFTAVGLCNLGQFYIQFTVYGYGVSCTYNGFTDPEFSACTGDVTADKRLMARLQQQEYDMVLVNIVADVIIHLAPTLPAFLQERSTLICSGILDTRLGDVTAALEKAGLTVIETKSKEDWRCVIAKK